VTTYPGSSTVADPSAQRGATGGRRFFHDRRLGVKLFAVVLCFVLVFTVVLALGAVSLLRFNSQEDQAASKSRDVLIPLVEARGAQIQSAFLIRRMAMAPNDSERVTNLKALDASTAQVNQIIAQVDARLTAPVAQWDEFKVVWNEWQVARDSKIVPIARAGNVAAVDTALAGLGRALVDARTALITSASDAVESRVNADSAAASADNQRNLLWVGLIFVVGLSLSVWFARSVIRQVTLAVGVWGGPSMRWPRAI